MYHFACEPAGDQEVHCPTGQRRISILYSVVVVLLFGAAGGNATINQRINRILLKNELFPRGSADV